MRDAATAERSTTSPLRRSSRARGRSRSRSTQLEAVGVTLLLEAIRDLDPGDQVLPGIVEPRCSAYPSETPQSGNDAVSPDVSVRRREGVRHLPRRRRTGASTACMRARPSSSTTSHRGDRSTSCPRKVAHGVAAIVAGREHELALGDLDVRRDWGYAPRLRRGDVADASAGRHPRLCDRDRRAAFRRRARRARLLRTPASTGARIVRVDESLMRGQRATSSSVMRRKRARSWAGSRR